MWDDRHSDVTNSSVFLARSLSDDIEMDTTSIYVATITLKFSLIVTLLMEVLC